KIERRLHGVSPADIRPPHSSGCVQPSSNQLSTTEPSEAMITRCSFEAKADQGSGGVDSEKARIALRLSSISSPSEVHSDEPSPEKHLPHDQAKREENGERFQAK